MTTEIGPLQDRDESAGLFERYSRFWLVGIFEFFDRVTDDVGIRYDRHANMLRLHGESESPGDEFSRSMLLSLGVMMVWALCYTLLIVADGMMLLPLLVIATPAILGSFDAWRHAEIIDHTHAKVETERVEELQQQFVDGEIEDRDEFAERIEQEMEANS